MKVVKMLKKYLLIYLVALILITGCIEFPQTKMEKKGWDQVEYEEYSLYYNILQPTPEKTITQSEYNVISKNMTIDEWLISIPKDKNEFEMTWYLVFYHIKKAQDMRPIAKDCSGALYSGMSPEVSKVQCQIDYQTHFKKQVEEIYSKAADYRQKIEDMKTNINSS